MADEPVVAPAPAESVPAPVATPPPAAEPAAAVEVVQTPAASEAGVDPAPSSEPAPASSILAEAAKETPAAEEPAKQPDAQADAEKPAETPVEPPPPEPVVYSDFEFPEGFQPDTGEVSAFTEILAKHRAPQELGQELVSFYADEMSRLETAQRTLWDRTQNDWQSQARSDAEIGGNHFDTTIKACGRVLNEFGTPALREVLTATGAGNHPEVIRFVNKIAQVLSEGRPVPASSPAPAPASKAQRRYTRSPGVASNG